LGLGVVVAALAIPAVALSLASSACGPSFQAIYEGNSRFEHCYALEENPQSPMPEKADCWRDWSEHYTYGQTRDRVQYAIARYVALSQAPNAPTDEAMMMAAPGETPRVSNITAPQPTNAFAPPPKVLADMPDADPSTVARPQERSSDLPTYVVGSPHNPDASMARPLPSEGCSDQCAKDFRSCSVDCVGRDGGSHFLGGTPCKSCDGTYAACMRGCFK
jgi:hypothetical protein